MSGGPQACKNAGTWRDTAWRVLNSDAWAVILIALTTLLALFRPICWFISRGQTFGGEMRAARSVRL